MQWMGDAQRHDKKLRFVVIGAGVLIILLAIAAGYFFWQSRSSKDDATAKSKSVISEVSDLYLVPTGETPTVAAIQDKSKLSGQAFFTDAQNGDYVLIYSKAKLAILYRENVNKLVNVGPVNMNASSGTDTTGGQ